MKERHGIKVAIPKALDAHKELYALKHSIANSYKENQTELNQKYIFKGRLSVEDWINSIPVMKTRSYNQVKLLYEEEGIEALLLKHIPHKPR